MLYGLRRGFCMSGSDVLGMRGRSRLGIAILFEMIRHAYDVVGNF
jgi:hypothetical protein